MNFHQYKVFIIRALFFLLLLGSFDLKAVAFEELVAPQQKVFKNTVEHQYREQIYKQKALVLVNKPLLGNQGPDRSLLNMLSAMNEKNYDWWLDLWDKSSKAEIIAEINNSKEKVETLKQKWVAELEGRSVFLGRWIETSQFVMLTYKLQNKKNSKKFSEEKAVVFVLEGGLWKATKKFTDDQFLAAVLSGQKKITINVR